MTTKTNNYLIPTELLDEVISGLKAYGKTATADTVKKLKNLEREEIEEWGSIVDPDSV